MKYLTALLTSVVLAITLFVATADDTVMKEIDAGNHAFAQAIMDGDVDLLVESYTSDACIIAPSTPLTCGHGQIKTFWTAVIGSNPKHVAIETTEAASEGTLAYAHGQLKITDSTGSLHENKFVLVLKRLDDEWKLHLDTWTPN